MPKIDLTGRINGDFVVLSEYTPKFTPSGKKKARWLCECQTCHEKEVVSGESIRRGKHTLCSYCVLLGPEPDEYIDNSVKQLNECAEITECEKITAKQFIKMSKAVQGFLPDEEKANLPKIFHQTFN